MDEQPTRILLVEDESAHRELILRAFDPLLEQYHLSMAETLEQARAIIDAALPHLVITDLRLPDGLGTELISTRIDERQFPLIVMTAFGDEKIAVEAMKAGALDYVVKSPESMAAIPRTAERALREWNHILERKRAEQALEKRVHMEQTSARISTFFLALQPGDIDRGVELALRRIGSFSACDRSFALFLDEAGQAFDSVHEWCAPGIEASLGKRRSIMPEGFISWASQLQRQEEMQSMRLAALPPDKRASAEALLGRDAQSAILVPLSRADQLAGLIGLVSVQSEKDWSEEDLVLLRAVGWMMVNALDRKRSAAEIDYLLAAERRQRIQAETLAEVGLALTLHSNYEAVLDEILDQTGKIIPYTQAEIILVEAEGLYVARTHGMSLIDEGRVRTPPLQRLQLDGLDQRVIQSGQPLLIHSTGEQEGTFSPQPGKIGSILSVPIILESRVLGVLRLMSELPGLYSEADFQRVKPLANAAAVAIDKARLIEGLEVQVAERTAEIRAEQERTSAVLQAAGNPVLVADKDWVIRFGNPALFAMTGYTADELLGQPVGAFLASMEPPGLEASMRAALAQGGLWQKEVAGQRKDGSLYEAAMLASFVQGDDGQVIGLVASLQDITRFKVLERAQKKFMHNVSHELRTPIANIQLYTHLLENLKGRQTPGQYLQIIAEQTGLLADLVDDILEVTSLESGSLAMPGEPIDLEALVRKLSERASSRAKKAGLEFQVAPLPAPLPVVKGDQALLIRAVEELIENAINFQPGGGKISILVESREAGGQDWLTLTVIDEGPGIPHEEQDRIFERFYRGSLAEENHTPGMGLGLSLVHSIMAAHGGKVSLNSAPGQGSTFILWLRAEMPA